MITFEVSLNGSRICTAGVGDLGVLTTTVSWVRRESSDANPSDIVEELTLQVGGLIASTKEHVRWTDGSVAAGDEVIIRIVDQESADFPTERRHTDPKKDIEAQERYVEQMARRFGWTIHKGA
jgi:hypothetical protein